MSKWQPIETAPRNAVACLIFCPDATEPQIILAAYRRYQNSDDPTDFHEGWYDFWDEDAPELDVEPTHWVPLPKPPEASP